MAAAKLFDALEVAGHDIAKKTAAFTQEVVRHRFMPFCSYVLFVEFVYTKQTCTLTVENCSLKLVGLGLIQIRR